VQKRLYVQKPRSVELLGRTIAYNYIVIIEGFDTLPLILEGCCFKNAFSAV
jgi:hypothetical protein